MYEKDIFEDNVKKSQCMQALSLPTLNSISQQFIW